MGKTTIKANLVEELNQIGNAEIRHFIEDALQQVTKGTKRASVKVEEVNTAIGYAKVVVYYAAKLCRLNKATELETDEVIASCLLGSFIKASGVEKCKLVKRPAAESFQIQCVIATIISRGADKRFLGDVIIEELSTVDRVVLCASHLVAPRTLFEMPNVGSGPAPQLKIAA